VWRSSRTTSGAFLPARHACANSARRLISQIAEELWEVKDRKIVNLTKMGIDIKAYKQQLMKNSAASIEKARRESFSGRPDRASTWLAQWSPRQAQRARSKECWQRAGRASQLQFRGRSFMLQVYPCACPFLPSRIASLMSGKHRRS
jgi:hypothetical protein